MAGEHLLIVDDEDNLRSMLTAASTSPLNATKPQHSWGFGWSGRRDSNPRPSPWQGYGIRPGRWVESVEQAVVRRFVHPVRRVRSYPVEQLFNTFNGSTNVSPVRVEEWSRTRHVSPQPTRRDIAFAVQMSSVSPDVSEYGTCPEVRRCGQGSKRPGTGRTFGVFVAHVPVREERHHLPGALSSRKPARGLWRAN